MVNITYGDFMMAATPQAPVEDVTEIQVLNSKERLIKGWASVDVKDVQGDAIPTEVMKDAFLKYMLINNGILMFKHLNRPVGRVLHWQVKFNMKAQKYGIQFVAIIKSGYKFFDIVWDGIQKKILKGFSIGADVPDPTVNIVERDGKKVPLKVDMNELSAVFDPANPYATLDEFSVLAKSAGADAKDVQPIIDFLEDLKKSYEAETIQEPPSDVQRLEALYGQDSAKKLMEIIGEDDWKKLLPAEEKGMEKMEGGLAEGKHPAAIADKHSVSLDHINNQLNLGIQIEQEHTDSEQTAWEIAMDHLYEDPDYYTKLMQMEKQDMELSQKLIDFFRDNPNPTDEQIHAFATEQGMTPDDVEEQIYSMISDFVRGKEKGTTNKETNERDPQISIQRQHQQREAPLDTETRVIAANLQNLGKARKYIKDPGQAPEGVSVQRGSRGGYYYEVTQRPKGEPKPEKPKEEKKPKEKKGRKPRKGEPLKTKYIRQRGEARAIPEKSWFERMAERGTSKSLNKEEPFPIHYHIDNIERQFATEEPDTHQIKVCLGHVKNMLTLTGDGKEMYSDMLYYLNENALKDAQRIWNRFKIIFAPVDMPSTANYKEMAKYRQSRYQSRVKEICKELDVGIEMLKAKKLLGRLKELEKMVRKRGDEYCVLHGHPKKPGSKTDKPKGAVIACHPTKAKAEAQHRAIMAQKHKELFKEDDRPPKEWFDKKVAELRQDPNVEDPEAVAGHIWYHLKKEDISLFKSMDKAKGKPPKEWFDKKVSELRQDPDVEDPEAVAAHIWYHVKKENEALQSMAKELQSMMKQIKFAT